MSQQFDILFVEDEQVIVDAGRRILTSEGFNIDEALNAEIALQKLQQNRYKLILSDLMLPHISGIELIKKVKSANPDIPIIIITGYAMLENAVKSFKAGAFDFIPKPFDVEELLGVIYRAMNHIKMMQDSDNKQKRFQPFDVSVSANAKASFKKYHFLGEHSWAKLDEDGVTLIGAGETFAGKMGAIEQVEFPIINTEIRQGNLCVRIVSQENLVHMVWAPLSGSVVGINQEIEKNANLINTDPFNLGWLVKIIPTNLESELENLILHYI
jgi:CheY-like chemotaxis protein/glycine cleavage system H lipoate-binding protein